MDKVGIAVLGMGRQGQIHSRNVAYMVPNARLVAASDISMDRVAATPVEGVDLYDDYRRVLERSDVDGVVVATSTDTHEAVVRACADAGKHVLCEKPIATTLPAIDSLLEYVAATGVKFMVAFNRRFDPTFARVRRMVEDGTVGDPMIVAITSRDPAPPHLEYLKVCGGIFFDTSVHDFDMARFLTGLEVEEVYATGSVLVDERIGALGDLDTTMITLRFAGGAVGSINNSRRTGFSYDQRVEVMGSKATAFGGNEQPSRASWIDPHGTHADVPLYFNTERYPAAFLGEMQAFVDSIANDTPPPATGHDGRTAVALSMAARKSFEEHRPVRLEEVG